MRQYLQFRCSGCQSDVAKEHAARLLAETGRDVRVDIEQDIYCEFVSVGGKRKCSLKGCTKKATRIFGTPNVIIKGKTDYDWKSGESMVSRVNGKDMRFTFVDHPHTDPSYGRKLAGLARQQGITHTGGLGNTHIHEKTGKPCVSVVSNIPDPLGAMNRARKAGDVVETKMAMNASTRRRK